MFDARLPDNLTLARVTDEWDESTAPAGLRSAHRVADGVWGRLVVRSGDLAFVFEADDRQPDQRRTIAAGEHVVIPPGRLHHVEFTGPVRFAVEFHREPR